ncbi:hypothetical protein MNEG_6283 [Monoraphidium neglectum]|uniref:Uncharacterized protein n=1 Tax=Monoraphidium neglectum TaxID=145388 RepID=A0A0D2N762_9CHLO|nr:hypothetical protein MNEG_6283 [Monoraphidium neglectum]KIZ01676.1 hypothetical protein MNEG_6283 [Monoraphidium neglectum]|eukprot:XP_013900695.1 hypothetical protein MNEG_6283 [Monoraphidium neglectum]
MRETRDTAIDEAARAKADLRELAAAHESLVTSSRDARLAADVRLAELVGEAKLRAYEMTRVQALCDERGVALREARDQAELLEDKVRALTSAALALEADRDRATAELRAQLDAAVGQLAQYEAAEMGLAGAALVGPTHSLHAPDGGGGAAGSELQQAPAGGGGGGVGAEGGKGSRPLRALGLTALSARCTALEAEKGELRRGWREAEGKLARAEGELANARQRLAAAAGPTKFVLERMEEAQARATEAEARAAALQAALEAREGAHRAALEERSALRSDLSRLLRERGALDSLRALVAGALGKAAAGGGGEG